MPQTIKMLKQTAETTTGEYVQAAVAAGMLVDCGGEQQGEERGEHQAKALNDRFSF